MFVPVILAVAVLASPYTGHRTPTELRGCAHEIRAELREHRAHVPMLDVKKGCKNLPNKSDVRVFEDGSWWAFDRTGTKIVGCIPNYDCSPY